ncbi:MAG: hypothetical protein ACK5MZ_07930 [Aestuariibaculum sp.]
MNKIYIFLLIGLLMVSCSSSVENDNCKNIPNVGFSVPIDLRLPQYIELLSPAKAVPVYDGGYKGIIVVNVGSGFRAWDACDPNHPPSNSCMPMEISGIEAECNCGDGNIYSLINGLILNNDELSCPLKEYRVEQNGDMLYISN